jgi:hypothetical protein
MIGTLITLVIYVVVLGLVVGLLLYVIDTIPVPEPFHRIARVMVIVVGCLILIVLLLSLIGDAPSLPRLR